MSQSYEIVVRGHLTPQWTAIFDGMQLCCMPDGSTCITGSLPDQAAVYGLLMHLRDFGIDLISINPVILKEETQR